ncbi:hypothetical protein HPB50_016945 [Hyalomma asiaticum]|uniref:Uncharacterized protein n=1 Tax=Hyalomma asiaticum TaxID=266040 RepID=A0ACB7SZW6_HYAAI|nr:hypothetical protein HPB50_016945 [Hyalomma asiaticum]
MHPEKSAMVTPLPQTPTLVLIDGSCSLLSRQDTESSSPPGSPPAVSKKTPGCSWRDQWRIGALMGASVVSLYCCVFWLIYALSMEGGRRPGLFLSATCLLLLVALGVTLLSIRKLCDLLAPAPVPV